MLGAVVFLIPENRRPQATLAWMLTFILAPGIGALLYILYGRDSKALSKQTKLLLQDLEGDARPLLSPIMSRQDAAIEQLESEGTSHKRLMMLVRRNSHSVLTTRNQVEILTAKARAGVEVRLLYDSLGSRTHLTRGYVSDLERAGGWVAPTAPLWHPHTISYRNHRKITVIDGAVGYTGGMNIWTS